MAAPTNSNDELSVIEADVEKDCNVQDSVSEVDTTDCKQNNEPTLSKSQLKKLRKKEKWNQVKAQKRKAEKERYKARKHACRERGEDLGPSRKQLRHNKMSKSTCKMKVAIDCDFDDYMAEKDIKMLVKQIQFSYSANRRAENPMQFYCCGVNGKTKERLESLGDYKGWDINFRSQNYLDIFDKSSVVYLSSESPNMLEQLEEDKVYIIGGLVDHNHHKGLCHNIAEEKGIAHAQLPISEYIDMKTRKVLTINHVFEILLQFTITKDWQKAFYTVLPPRKGAVPKVIENNVCDVDEVKPNNEVTDNESEEDSRSCAVEKSCDLEIGNTDLQDEANSVKDAVNDKISAVSSGNDKTQTEVINQSENLENRENFDGLQEINNSDSSSCSDKL